MQRQLTLLALAALVVAGALPGVSPASAAVDATLFDRPVHAPVVIAGNADFNAANGVTGGSGTADDPYVIAGWTFLVESGPNYLITGAPTGRSTVTIQDTTAHVVVRDNTFLATTPTHAGDIQISVESAAGVLLQSARNVTVAGNDFEGVGGTWRGAVGVFGGSHDVAVEENVFRGGDRPTVVVDHSLARVVGNDVAAHSHDCCIDYEIVRLRGPVGGTEVVDNRINGTYGAGFGSGHTAIGVGGTIPGDDPVVIAGNAIVGNFNGIVAYNPWDDAPRGVVHVLNNTVSFTDYGWTCLRVTGPGGVVAGNVFDGCNGFDVDSQVEVGRNLYRGGITLSLESLRDAVVDPEPDRVTWFRAQDLENVTLRGLHVVTPGAAASFRDARNLTIEDATFQGGGGSGVRSALHVEAAGDLVLRNVTVQGYPSNVFVTGAAVDLVAEGVATQGGKVGMAVQLNDASSVVVRDSAFKNATAGGLQLHGFGSALVERTAFTGNGEGLRVNAPGGSVTVRNATFHGNGYAVTTEVGLPVDARWSWWGDASGPTAPGNPDGSGDAVLGPVAYAPWLPVAP